MLFNQKRSKEDQSDHHPTMHLIAPLCPWRRLDQSPLETSTSGCPNLAPSLIKREEMKKPTPLVGEANG